MPLVYQQNINATTQLGVWHISEPEFFFLASVPLQRTITHPHKRLQHLAGRHLLKVLYPDFPIELIKVANTRKPFLLEEKFHFSISHCGNYAAVCVSTTHRVGVDIELINNKIGNIIHKFLSEKEQQLYKREDQISIATLYWCVKESIFKWFGDGAVDFKNHMHITKINKSVVEVDFLKNASEKLAVHFLPFKDHFLSWILTLA